MITLHGGLDMFLQACRSVFIEDILLYVSKEAVQRNEAYTSFPIHIFRNS
jgi:hypothetical protein